MRIFEVEFPTVKASKIELVIESASGDPVIRDIKAYFVK